MTRTSYLEFYVEEIAPRLKAIDLALKSDDGIPADYAGELLNLTTEEVIAAAGTDILTRACFLRIMRDGSSEICRLFKRELEKKSPMLYSAEDIAYIYDISQELVDAAFGKIGGKFVSAYMLPTVFSEINSPC